MQTIRIHRNHERSLKNDFLRRLSGTVFLIGYRIKRLAPAEPANDGEQTPMRGAPKGHPVFLAQHATATCCRGCLEKWHGIEKGRALSDDEQRYVVDGIMRWIRLQIDNSKMGL